MSEITKTIRTRFAPSPTGYVHIGSLRTALFAFLFARHGGGVNVLRIEDTDRTRLVDDAVENLLKVMNDLGIIYDEGYFLNSAGHAEEKGEYGPYLQSKRLEVYKKYIVELIANKKAYYCFCSQARLDDLRKEQTALKKPPMYDRHCRNLTEAEVAQKLSEATSSGQSPVVRQAIPQDGQTIIHDLVFGDIAYDHKVLDDQVLLKSDGFPTYHLAVVVDDHLMEMTHVIRSEEWIPSTPKHLLLYEAFGWQAPAFAHLPLVLNTDKTKLSKRQGDVAVEDFLQKGYLKEALINFVAFLGWNPKTEQEVFSLQDLITQFDIKKINKSGAIFDLEKLDWMNGLYIRAKSNSELTDLLIPYWEKEGFTSENKNYLESITGLEKDRLKKLSEIGERTGYFFKKPENVKELLVSKKSTPEATKNGLLKLHEYLKTLSKEDFVLEILEPKVKSFIESESLKNIDVLWPMRVALTGLAASPSPFEVASTLVIGLGESEVLERIEAAASLI